MSGRIVVGVDGCERADAAVHWALAEARIRCFSLEVVPAWTPPYAADLPGFAVVDLTNETEKDADELLRRVVERAVGDGPEVEVTSWTVKGSAARVLIDAAKGADMLVVASRGRVVYRIAARVREPGVLHHAPCPIVVIPSRRSVHIR